MSIIKTHLLTLKEQPGPKMQFRSLYTSVGSVMVATVVAAVAITTISTSQMIEMTKRKEPTYHSRKSQLRMKKLFCRGYHIEAAAERRLFQNGAFLPNIKKTIKFLQLREFPINPFFVVYYSKYSGEELSIIEACCVM